jgi:hypothetical protein
MERIKIAIGIDPDVDNSGIACWDKTTKSFDYIKNMSFWDIIEEFEAWNINIEVVIEAGWLIKKSNWHGHSLQNKSVGERIAKNVGSNHQVGKLLNEYCLKKGIKVTLVKPKGKINAKTFKNITNYKERTNQDKRDAAMLVYGM